MKIKMYEVREDERAAIRAAGHSLKVEIKTDPAALTLENVQGAQGFEGVSVLGRSVLDAQMLDRLAELGVQYISTRTIGYNHIDLPHAKVLGLRVSNASYPPYGVAEFTVMMMLLAIRKYKPAMWRQGVNDYSLDGLQGRELRTMTVGVMGTGRIGRTVIRILSDFGCRILAYDPFPSEEVRRGAEYVDMETLLHTSDLITLHVPLSEATRHIIDRDAIAKMKKGVVLVNVSRGELMDIEALTQGIESEQIGALAMDVFEDENGIYHHSLITDIVRNREMAYIRQFPNVVLTQHMAFYTDVDTDSMADGGVRGIVQMARGESCPCEL